MAKDNQNHRDKELHDLLSDVHFEPDGGFRARLRRRLRRTLKRQASGSQALWQRTDQTAAWVILTKIRQITFSTAVFALVIAAFVMIGRFMRPPGLQPLSDSPEVFIPLDVTIGPARLTGYQTALAGSQLTLMLYWESLESTAADGVVFVQFFNSQGTLVGQQDSRPNNGSTPLPDWQPGDVITDTRQYLLNELPPGEYWLYVGLYDADSGQRFPASDASGTPLPDNAAVLGPIDYPGLPTPTTTPVLGTAIALQITELYDSAALTATAAPRMEEYMAGQATSIAATATHILQAPLNPGDATSFAATATMYPYLATARAAEAATNAAALSTRSAEETRLANATPTLFPGTLSPTPVSGTSIPMPLLTRTPYYTITPSATSTPVPGATGTSTPFSGGTPTATPNQLDTNATTIARATEYVTSGTFPPRGAFMYIVQSGDTLSSIAVSFGMTPGLLMQVNELASENSLFTGMLLIIPPTVTPTFNVTPTGTPTPTATPLGQFTVYAPEDAILRWGPGNQWPQVATLPAGETLPAIGRDSSGEWIQVLYDGLTFDPQVKVWVYEESVELRGGEVEDLPRVVPTTTPTPSP